MTADQLQEALDRITERIQSDFDPEKIILFGSHAWGIPSPDSDIDVLVIKETANTRQTAAEIDGTIFPRDFPLDVMVCKPGQMEHRAESGDPFMDEILKKGKILYERS